MVYPKTLSQEQLLKKRPTPYQHIITIESYLTPHYNTQVGSVWHPSINQTCLHYFKTQPSSIQPFSGLPSNPRERTSSWVSYLTMGPLPLACWSPICSGSAQTSWPGLTLGPNVGRTQKASEIRR